MTWWKQFFDDDYLRLWAPFLPDSLAEQQTTALWQLLHLEPGRRVLDAPCGYGRLSKPLAARGAKVLGLDYSAPMLEEAERRRGELPAAQLRYLRHDLREPLPEGNFHAALNAYCSLGYGTEDEDLAILKNTAAALEPGGWFFLESLHRDSVAAIHSRSFMPEQRYPDGTRVLEKARFDAFAGTLETTWRWSGPHGSGEKTSISRVYTLGELVALLERAGLRYEAAFKGCSASPFAAEGPNLGGLVGLLARRA